MIKTKCLECGIEFIFNQIQGLYYFLGYDDDDYGESDEYRDPHEIVGYYCKKCGDKLRKKGKKIGEEVFY